MECQICDPCNEFCTWGSIKRDHLSASSYKCVVGEPFRDHLKQLCSEWLLAEVHVLTPTRMKDSPTVELLCQWTNNKAMDTAEMVVRGFKTAARDVRTKDTYLLTYLRS
jgi:hypothetical protein